MRSVKYVRSLLVLVVLLLGANLASAGEARFVRMDTDAGSILLVLYPELAPHHVDNFVHLCETGFYEGTQFHRIIPGFMIQGGDPNTLDGDPRTNGMGGPGIADVLDPAGMQMLDQVNEMLAAKGYVPLAGRSNLKAEFSPGVPHIAGTLSMARSRDVDSAGSQFFVCVARAASLDGQYTVFGQVVSGQSVADTIVNAEKDPAVGRDAPAKPVSINRMTVIEGTADLTAEEKAAWDDMPDNLKNIRKG